VAEEVVIVSVGAVTPVGLSAVETAANARSRTARLEPLAIQDTRFRPLTCGAVPDEGLEPLHGDLEPLPLQAREARMLRLAHIALEDLFSKLPKEAGPFPVFLALPEHATKVALDPAEFLQRLALQAEAKFDVGRSQTFAEGRAAGLLACLRAAEKIQSQEVPLALVGGVECLLDLYVLGVLDMQQRIRTDSNSDGFAPSEGAAFLALTTRKIADKKQFQILARMFGGATAEEPGHLFSEEPYRGEGMAEAWEKLFDACQEAPPAGCVFNSFNGERYWAKEFGVAFLRHQKKFQDPCQVEHPAEVFGDLGAAHGAVLAVLAALGIRDGYRRPPVCVTAASDHALRAAILLGPA